MNGHEHPAIEQVDQLGPPGMMLFRPSFSYRVHPIAEPFQRSLSSFPLCHEPSRLAAQPGHSFHAPGHGYRWIVYRPKQGKGSFGDSGPQLFTFSSHEQHPQGTIHVPSAWPRVVQPLSPGSPARKASTAFQEASFPAVSLQSVEEPCTPRSGRKELFAAEGIASKMAAQSPRSPGAEVTKTGTVMPRALFAMKSRPEKYSPGEKARTASQSPGCSPASLRTREAE